MKTPGCFGMGSAGGSTDGGGDGPDPLRLSRVRPRPRHHQTAQCPRHQCLCCRSADGSRIGRQSCRPPVVVGAAETKQKKQLPRQRLLLQIPDLCYPPIRDEDDGTPETKKTTVFLPLSTPRQLGMVAVAGGRRRRRRRPDVDPQLPPVDSPFPPLPAAVSGPPAARAPVPALLPLPPQEEALPVRDFESCSRAMPPWPRHLLR
jgi:hypothetical protein